MEPQQDHTNSVNTTMTEERMITVALLVIVDMLFTVIAIIVNICMVIAIRNTKVKIFILFNLSPL